jgi:hypothetical protein
MGHKGSSGSRRIAHAWNWTKHAVSKGVHVGAEISKVIGPMVTAFNPEIGTGLTTFGGFSDLVDHGSGQQPIQAKATHLPTGLMSQLGQTGGQISKYVQLAQNNPYIQAAASTPGGQRAVQKARNTFNEIRSRINNTSAMRNVARAASTLTPGPAKTSTGLPVARGGGHPFTGPQKRMTLPKNINQQRVRKSKQAKPSNPASRPMTIPRSYGLEGRVF